MSSYPLPEGEIVLRGWSGRRAAALAKRADIKDSYTKNALRGAHIRTEKIKAALHDRPSKDLEDELVEAIIALESAVTAHDAFELGETEAEAEAESESADGEQGTEPATPGDAGEFKPAGQGRRTRR